MKPGAAELVVGTSIIHRLTRAEYANTIRDLLGASLTSLDTLPPDSGADGFTKASVSQASSANTLQAYEAASDELVATVFKDPTLRAQLVTCDLSTGNACVRSTLEAFLPKAWRRPVQAAEVDRLMTLAGTEAQAGGSAEEQLRLALRAALISAKFLFLIEADPNPADTAPHALGDYELANRLSYFLWSSMPDSALTGLAAQGTLHDEAVLAQQVQRMLIDPLKGQAITREFASEWMQLQAIPLKQPDQQLFPMVNDALKQSMLEQSRMFFQDLLTSGGPISNLVASDYTFVDASLASLYGLPAPQGSGFVKTSLAGTTRIGGLLGQSSFLLQFASQVRSSPVKRGAWVLDNLFCAPSPPPPAAVAVANAAQEADPAFLAKVAQQTGRERLGEHRAPANCAVCHNRIDPIGLGLENYDAVGQYRTIDVGKVIDPSGQLDAADPKSTFADAAGLSALLAADPRVASCLGQKLLTFALTRAPTPTEVDYTGSLTTGNADSLSNLITKVVTGTPFRVRRGAGL
jgi:Protein of unknown function (DUF1592)/Protein of unknown function (DUF1588)/Protein of unknown function (DUF1595)/Protein of unknown function (DUF1587)/Protein of unknown function (DUF1585)